MLACKFITDLHKCVQKIFRFTLPRLCQEILNVIDMNVRKEKNGILSILQITNLHTELLKTCSVAQLVSANRCLSYNSFKQQHLTIGDLWVGLNNILDIKTSSSFLLKSSDCSEKL